jgi:electron transfer flavoprotein alpha subunit
MTADFINIWVWVQHREGTIEPVTFGLIAEARRIISGSCDKGEVTAVALGSGLRQELESLGAYGADKVVYTDNALLNRYDGELFCKVLFSMVKKYSPTYIFMAHNAQTQDLSSRLAAMMKTGLVTRAMDFKINGRGEALAVRPIANGYLFEEVLFNGHSGLIISFLPSVLSTPEPRDMAKVEIRIEPMDASPADLETELIKVIQAVPKELDLEEADVIVAGGRGVGRDKAFNVIQELADTLGASVGGTRPVIDWQMLPFERQIGQTGKTVLPRLIITCGISGANEFTAGMEDAQLVIAVDKDPRARIFRFADLGVVGDVHEVLPLLIESLKALKGDSTSRDHGTT